MAEDPQPMTLQQRIASLNAAHIGRIPGDPPPYTARRVLGEAPPQPKPKPQLPARPALPARQQTVNLPPEQLTGSVTDTRSGNQPNGPPQLPTRKQPPPLPSRNGPAEETRRPSVSSIASSNISDNTSRAVSSRTSSEGSSRVKAPAWGESQIPVPPSQSTPFRSATIPERPKYEIRAPSSNSVTSPDKPTSPPILPNRMPAGYIPPPLPATGRKLPPMPTNNSIADARKFGFGNSLEPKPLAEAVPRQPSPAPVPVPVSTIPRPASTKPANRPPPVPLASRPDLSAIQATKPRFDGSTNGIHPATNAHNQTECLTCRDFSAVDHHASLFPRQQVNSLSDLAHQLTAPFTSLTDKARVIFTWLHHNIDYDVVNFFNGTCKSSTPESTLRGGLAVCEGYAALFVNIATHAGMEAVVCSGHGKGYGHAQPAPGSPLPTFSSNHAWSAVKIDGGEWKLLDACWGAGHVQGKGKPYVRNFNPSMFAMSNEEFGVKHFPQNKDHFFLPGGRRLSWEEYIQINPESWPYEGEAPTVYTNARPDYSIGERTLFPRNRKIRVNSPETIRFQFGLLCEHWTLEHHTDKGPPPVFMVHIHGVDGRKDEYVPLERVRGRQPSGGGDMWYVDVPARSLGAPGQTVMLFAVTKFGDRSTARGLTVREFREAIGKVVMAWSGVASWDLT